MPLDGSDAEMDRLAVNLNRMLDQIRALMAGMRQISTDVAHDLRTLLGALAEQWSETKAPSIKSAEALLRPPPKIPGHCSSPGPPEYQDRDHEIAHHAL